VLTVHELERAIREQSNSLDYFCGIYEWGW